MDFICDRCGYTTNRSNNLKQHLTSKRVCKPKLSDIDRLDLYDTWFGSKIQEYECDVCKKTYKSKETLQKHHKKYHSDIHGDTTNDLLKQIITLLNKNNNTTYNVQNIVQNNILNVQQPSCEFLKENFDYISDEYIMSCAKKLDNGLVEFIKNVRFNPDHPENMNVKMHVKRDKTLYVYRNGVWEICDAKWTLEEMIVHGARIIHQKFLSISDQEKLLEDGSSESKIQSWLLSILPRDNDKVMGRLSKRLYAIILNNENLLLVEQPDLDDIHKDTSTQYCIDSF